MKSTFERALPGQNLHTILVPLRRYCMEWMGTKAFDTGGGLSDCEPYVDEVRAGVPNPSIDLCARCNQMLLDVEADGLGYHS